MQLRVPIDLLILRVLSNGEQANPTRVGYLIERDHAEEVRERTPDGDMWSLDYVTQRMSTLRGLELLERVPPDDSSLYRISPLGHAALIHALDSGKREFSFRDLLDEVDADATVDELDPVDPDRIDWDHLPNG